MMFLEYTKLRRWMGDYLRYLHWYWTVGQDDWASIEDMLDAPILMTSWFTPLMDKALERMALATSMYLIVEKLGLD